MRTTLFALVAVAALFGTALGPSVAAAADGTGDTEAGNTGLAVSVTQADDVTVTVTQNDSGVANASVDVDGEDNSSYDGIGEYTTDADGEVELPTPAVNKTISVTATYDNRTATAMTDLVSAESVEPDENATQSDAFGLQVTSFVQSLLGSNESAVGPQVAAFVTQHNPGNAPAHAGPPDHASPGNDDGDDERGPPDHAGPGNDDANETEDDRRGPPEDAGPPVDAGPGDDDGDDVNETDEETEDDTETEDEEATEAEEETENDDSDDDEVETEDSDDAETDDEDDSGGPPEHANAGGN